MAEHVIRRALHLGRGGGGLGRESDDVPGLATGADTLDALVDKLKVAIPELLEANGRLAPGDSSDIPFVIAAERQDRAPRAD